MMSENPNAMPSGVPAPRRRRARYSGTHPQRFEQRYKELDSANFPGVHQHVRAQGRTPAGTHVPVMVDEVLAALRPQPGDVVADCTLGFGGHALALARRVGAGGRLIGLDVDAVELKRAAARLAAAFEDDARESAGPALGRPAMSFHHSHFAGLGKVLAREKLEGVDVLLADLGVSSMQIDDPRRGFSYKSDGPLDMRMDERLRRTAADVLAEISLEELTAHLTDLADEPDAAAIARGIVRRRAVGTITRTAHLVDVVFAAKGLTRRQWRHRPAEQQGDLHPAARTFQALRMLVNDELAGLAQFLRIAPHCLRPGGRIGVISFHSGEDGRVAEAFRAGQAAGVYTEIAEAAIRPAPAEVAGNSRSRSALLRWAVRGVA
ncbi:MAG: 16S rRNA (cytosine(1402)-N(4))-methyltransferase RsmH [Planctomycetes bacterium]|nr:16S rRNA (cytosine(1402)-N(4))-methyltransferase RsmH [Planctomycetota bacterium]